MIVVCGGIKGGSGKSTAATNLAVICANAGKDVLLVDADDQETSADFTVLRNDDTTSQRAALTVADVLLVPFVPRSFDVWTLEKVAKFVSEMRAANPKLRAHVFLNRADPRGQDNRDTADVLKDTDAPTHLHRHAPGQPQGFQQRRGPRVCGPGAPARRPEGE